MANAAEIRVLSSNAIKEAYLELVPQFEKATGHTVATTWAPTIGIMKRMQEGETFDLVIMSAEAIDRLIKDGKLVYMVERRDIEARSAESIALTSPTPPMT